jgi:hypothetical protein
VPKFCVFSHTAGVIKLFKALPNYGNVVAIPIANANYLPKNQKDTKQVCATLKLSIAIPKNILPINII